MFKTTSNCDFHPTHTCRAAFVLLDENDEIIEKRILDENVVWSVELEADLKELYGINIMNEVMNSTFNQYLIKFLNETNKTLKELQEDEK